MQFNKYSDEQIKTYSESLARIGALSNLFSESVTPYINYRATEYIYSRSMEANNLSRSDIAIDAKHGSIGVGIKTFVYNNKPKYEKIAEFNKEIESFDALGPLEKIQQVAKLRNERIVFAGRVAEVDSFIYHCIARMPGKIMVFEQEMPYINLEGIEVTNVKGKNLSFNDGVNKYRFNASKSTLFKEFYSNSFIFEKDIRIYDDPFTLLNSLGLDQIPATIGVSSAEASNGSPNSIVLPLYGKSGTVYERSGLNQWNAKGRPRNLDEAYIPHPAEAQRKRPYFFPKRDTPFTLYLPNGKPMTVKICQDGGKALMSAHNAELGNWLLREVLQLQEGTLITRKLLDEIGIDSVEITKEKGRYEINFKKTGSYEDFLES